MENVTGLVVIIHALASGIAMVVGAIGGVMIKLQLDKLECEGKSAQVERKQEAEKAEVKIDELKDTTVIQLAQLREELSVAQQELRVLNARQEAPHNRPPDGRY